MSRIDLGLCPPFSESFCVGSECLIIIFILFLKGYVCVDQSYLILFSGFGMPQLCLGFSEMIILGGDPCLERG